MCRTVLEINNSIPKNYSVPLGCDKTTENHRHQYQNRLDLQAGEHALSSHTMQH